MELKRILAKDSRRALEKVSDEYGNDALLYPVLKSMDKQKLSSRSICIQKVVQIASKRQTQPKKKFLSQKRKPTKVSRNFSSKKLPLIQKIDTDQKFLKTS